MATANTLAAFEAGVQSADVTVNGLGERAGNAPLEEVAIALRVCLRRPPGVDTRALARLSRLVADAARRPVPASKPVVGQGVFCHESGIHVRGILDDRRTYEPFPPEEVGAAGSRIVLGKHSGTAAVRHVLAGCGVALTPDEVLDLLAAIRRQAVAGRTFEPRRNSLTRRENGVMTTGSPSLRAEGRLNHVNRLEGVVQ